MHEDNKIEGIKAGFDEVVRFRSSEVVTGFQYVEGRLDFETAIGGAGVLLPRKIGENSKLAFLPHLLSPMAHDLARTGSRNGTRRYEGDQRHFHVEITPNRSGNLPRVRKHFWIFHFRHDCQRGLAVFVNLECGDAIVPD